MLLMGDIFDEIGGLLRKYGGAERQRRLQVDVTLATTSAELIDARIHHFAGGGVGLITATPLEPGDRFGFEVPKIAGAHFLFCEVLTCRLDADTFMVNASFLEQEKRNNRHRPEMTN